MRCAVFSNNRNKAIEKMNEICKEKNIHKMTSNHRSIIYIFDDGECLEWVPVTESCIRSKRFSKAWIDNDIPQNVLQALCMRLLYMAKREDIHFF